MLGFIFLGIVAGLMAASVNGFKDSPWENFSLLKFGRSLIFLGPIAGLLMYFLDKEGALVISNPGILLMATIPIERGLAELYKGFIKKKDHIEYIELQKRLWIPLNNYIIKWLVGLLLVLLYVLVGILFAKIIGLILATSLSTVIKGFLSGTVAATIIALGGGIKDSQFEGFSIIKFFRSPLMGGLVGIILINFTLNPVTFLLAAIGLERTVVEFYKTFWTQKTRGIHVLKGIEPEYIHWFRYRWTFFATFVLSLALFVYLLIS